MEKKYHSYLAILNDFQSNTEFNLHHVTKSQ